MGSKEYRTTVSVKMGLDMLQALDKESGKEPAKRFTDRSDAIRYYVERGQQFDSLLQIYNNPEQRAEFESQLKSLAVEKDVERYLETIDNPKTLEAIIFLASNQKDKRVRQLMLDIRKA